MAPLSQVPKLNQLLIFPVLSALCLNCAPADLLRFNQMIKFYAFRDRIHHILEANGAFYDGQKNRGHAQKNQNISFNTIQPYPDGELQGLYPAIVIQP